MKRILTYSYLLVCFAIIGLQAQNYQFSQFYASPTYLNPAFTGANVCSRVSLNYRNQWAGIPGEFNSYQAAFDHSLKSYKSGIGLQFFSDNAGIGNLKTTQISLLYAYEAKLNKKLMGRGGLSFGSVQRTVDFGAFTFGDQIARQSNNSVEGFGEGRITYMDIGVGFLVYSASTWLGFSASHINKPDQSLMNEISPLPPELKFHGGYKLKIEEREIGNKYIPQINAVTFAFNFKNQSKFNQLDLGIYYTKNWFVIGAWYRGIPISKPNKQDINTDAFIVLTGLNFGSYKLGYSYDITISKLSNVATNGSHEISLAFQLCSSKKTKKKKNILISCPKF